MTKIIYRFLIIIFIIIFCLITYLSTLGLKTNKLNYQISEQIKKINKDLEIQLKEVKIILDPLSFKFNAKTLGTNLIYKNKQIQLESIKSSISIQSLLKNKFSLKKIDISTKSVEIDNLIPFIRLFYNDPKIYIAQKFIKDGYLIADIKMEFDQFGNIKNNYMINGFVKKGKIDFFKRYDISEIDLLFKIQQHNFELENSKLSINGKKFLISNTKIRKNKEKLLINGKFNNQKIVLNRNDIKHLKENNTLGLDLEKIEFSSQNSFSFEIDKKLKFKNLAFNSDIVLDNLSFLDEKFLKKVLPESGEKIIFKDHKINLDYKKNTLIIDGSGDFVINDKDKDKIQYSLVKKEKNINFDAVLKISNNLFELDYLNYKKKNRSSLQINIEGKKDSKNNIIFNKISLSETNNNMSIKNLMLGKDYSLKEFEKIYLNYVDNDKINNQITIDKIDKNYLLEGSVFNAEQLIKNLMKSEAKESNLFSRDFKLDIDIKKILIDKDNTINNSKGYLLYKNGNIFESNIKSEFSNKDKVKFTVKTINDEKITTLFSSRAKPLINHYKFIKGFKDGSLDFFSTKKGNKTNSTLKIYDFKLKELPALTKLLTLASLQGIADLLSGEGIRFNEFEMNFTKESKLMTINEIYAIGPAISVLMNGYIEEDKLISLRGTLVPATTLNKTIGAIPILGDILVGKKTGEGVFGVSFKIKGAPNKLETSVNPIKTLTPRFITRTLEKIKKN